MMLEPEVFCTMLLMVESLLMCYWVMANRFTPYQHYTLVYHTIP